MKKTFAVLLSLLVTHLCVAATLDEQIGELTRRCSRSLVIVRSGNSAGSGFLAQHAGQKCLFTNQHVVAGSATATFTLPDQQQVRVGTAAAAVDHDIITYGVPADSEVLETMEAVDQGASIGDEVAVLGNPSGGGVIHPLVGKIVGIGPQLVEISAEIVPGNSGSPVVHLKTGKVIAVASYLKFEKADFTKGQMVDQVRRFCYRLDSIKKWERVRWGDYTDDDETLRKVRARTRDFFLVLLGARGLSQLSLIHLKDPGMADIVGRYQKSMGAAKTVHERLMAAEGLLNELHAASTEDMDRARRRIAYDYFTKMLDVELTMRQPFPVVMSEARKYLSQLDGNSAAVAELESRKRR